MTLAHSLDQHTEVINKVEHTLLNDEKLQGIFELQQQAFAQQPYASYEQRKQHLLTLQQMLVEHQDDIAQAISRDFANRSVD